MGEKKENLTIAVAVWAVIATAVLAGSSAALPGFGVVAVALFVALTSVALLSLTDPASRGFLAGTLRKSSYTQIYTTLTKRSVMRLWSALCDPVEDRAPLPRLMGAALTWRLYDRALLIAVVYPIRLLVGQWLATGAPATLGGAEVIPPAPFWWDRAAVLVMIAVFTMAPVLAFGAAAKPYIVTKHLSNWPVPIAVALIITVTLVVPVVLVVAFAFAFTGASAFAVAGAVAFAFAFTVAVEGAVASAFAGAFAVAVAGAGAGAFAGAVAVAGAVAMLLLTERLEKRGRPALARWLLAILLVMALIAAASFGNHATSSEHARAIFLFLGVFPLLNAVFDTASYAVTLTLMRRGLRSRLPLLWGVLDLAFACLLFLGLGAALVGVVHGLNALAGATLLDLPALLTAARDDPMGHLWLYLMLFSTIVPTALHALLSLLGVQGLWPRAWRRPVAGWVERAGASPLAALRAALGLGLVWTLPILALGAVVWLAWRLAGGLILGWLEVYFAALLWLAG